MQVIGAFRKKLEMKDAILRKAKPTFLRGKDVIEDETKHRLRKYSTRLT